MASIRYRLTRDRAPMWQVRYRVGTKPNVREKSKTFDDEQSALEYGRLVDDLGGEEAERILDARSSAVTKPPLATWCREYIDTLSGVQDGTRDRYRRIVDTRLGRMGRMPVDTIDEDHVAAWVNDLSTHLSGKTISNYHGFLSAAFKAAVRRKLATHNPCEGTRIPESVREEMVTLTTAEFTHFLTHVRADARGMVTTLPWTGLRFGEITALRARDINADTGTITVVQAWKYVEKGAPVLGPPKSKKSRRTIRVPGAALSALLAAREGKAPDDLLFTNTAGDPWTRSRFHEGVWQPAVRAANDTGAHNPENGDRTCNAKPLGKRPRVHDMRHTCASWLLSAGSDMYTVQRYLGHESFTTTESVYAHLDPVRMSRAADALTAFAQIES